MNKLTAYDGGDDYSMYVEGSRYIFYYDAAQGGGGVQDRSMWRIMEEICRTGVTRFRSGKKIDSQH